MEIALFGVGPAVMFSVVIRHKSQFTPGVPLASLISNW